MERAAGRVDIIYVYMFICLEEGRYQYDYWLYAMLATL